MSKMGDRIIEMEEFVSSEREKGVDFDVVVERLQHRFTLSDAAAENFVWDLIQPDEDPPVGYRFSHGVMYCGDDEPQDSYDLSDDAEALASAGYGTDEDYGGIRDEMEF